LLIDAEEIASHRGSSEMPNRAQAHEVFEIPCPWKDRILLIAEAAIAVNKGGSATNLAEKDHAVFVRNYVFH